MGEIRCPCSKCDCTRVSEERHVKVHFYKHGFKSNYSIWNDHGVDILDGDLYNDDNCMALGMDGVTKCKPVHNYIRINSYVKLHTLTYEFFPI